MCLTSSLATARACPPTHVCLACLVFGTPHPKSLFNHCTQCHLVPGAPQHGMLGKSRVLDHEQEQLAISPCSTSLSLSHRMPVSQPILHLRSHDRLLITCHGACVCFLKPHPQCRICTGRQTRLPLCPLVHGVADLHQCVSITNTKVARFRAGLSTPQELFLGTFPRLLQLVRNSEASFQGCCNLYATVKHLFKAAAAHIQQ